MKKTFFNLNKSRKNKIKKIAIEEFVKYGYDLSSINRIVKKLNIAKGSFYNYIYSKEDLYLFLLEDFYNKTASLQSNKTSYNSNDIFKRARDLLKENMKLFELYPLEYKFIIQAETDVQSSIYSKAHKLRQQMSNNDEFFNNIDWSMYRMDKPTIIRIFSWITSGIREEIKISIQTNQLNPKDIMSFIDKQFEILDILLLKGIYKK